MNFVDGGGGGKGSSSHTSSDGVEEEEAVTLYIRGKNNDLNSYLWIVTLFANLMFG